MDIAGARLNVVVRGRPDGPPLLFSSGLGGAWFDWDLTTALLIDEYRVICFDRPGLGNSPPSRVAPGLPAAVRELAGLATWAGATDAARGGPATVVAHSMAAFHAEALARLHPELVGGLVLVDPSCEPTARVRLRLASALTPAYRAAGAALEVTGLARRLGPWAHRRIVRRAGLRGEIVPNGEIEAVYGQGRVLGRILAENQAYPQMAADLLALRERRPFPPIPLVVLTALGDLRSDDARSRWSQSHAELAVMSPRGRQVELPGCSHLVPFDRPDAIADAVVAVRSVR